MHLIFIRHGDPDYSIDSVTEKGKREIELLGNRISRLNPTEFFVSPMGRAQETAKACLEKLEPNFSAEPLKVSTLPWLREFSYEVRHPKTGKKKIPWDWLPRDYFMEKKYFDAKKWHSTKAMKSGGICSRYKEVRDGIDEILSSYDYTRTSEEIPIYNCFPHLTPEEAAIDTHLQIQQRDLDEKNLVFVCHLGVMFAIISHLIGMSPVQLWQGFFVAPSSVTIVGAEERIPGEVAWRIQALGDASHLIGNGEEISASGFFGNCMTL